MFIIYYLLFFTYGDFINFNNINNNNNKNIEDILINFEMSIYNYFNNGFKKDLTKKILELREKIGEAYHLNSHKKQPAPIIINIDLNYYADLPIIIEEEDYFPTIQTYEQKILRQQNVFKIQDSIFNVNDEYLNKKFLQFISPVLSFIINIFNDNSFIVYKNQQEDFFNIEDEKELLSQILSKINSKQNSSLIFDSINSFLSKKNNYHYLFINDQENYFNPFHEIILESNIYLQEGKAPKLENPSSRQEGNNPTSLKPPIKLNSSILDLEQEENPNHLQPSRPNQNDFL